MNQQLYPMEHFEKIEQQKKNDLCPEFQQNLSNDQLFPDHEYHFEQESTSQATKFGEEPEKWQLTAEETDLKHAPEKFMEDDQQIVNSINQCAHTQRLSQVHFNVKVQASSSNDSQSQSESNNSSGKTSKIKKISKDRKSKKNDYPTKNFLPKFKQAILSYLRQHLKEKFDNYEFLKQIQNKKGISMKDYQDIFTQQDFKQILIQMFEKKHFYRVLMVSRVTAESRKILIKKIPVFYYAFIRGKFTNIN